MIVVKVYIIFIAVLGLISSQQCPVGTWKKINNSKELNNLKTESGPISSFSADGSKLILLLLESCENPSNHVKIEINDFRSQNLSNGLQKKQTLIYIQNSNQKGLQNLQRQSNQDRQLYNVTFQDKNLRQIEKNGQIMLSIKLNAQQQSKGQHHYYMVFLADTVLLLISLHYLSEFAKKKKKKLKPSNKEYPQNEIRPKLRMTSFINCQISTLFSSYLLAIIPFQSFFLCLYGGIIFFIQVNLFSQYFERKLELAFQFVFIIILGVTNIYCRSEFVLMVSIILAQTLELFKILINEQQWQNEMAYRMQMVFGTLIHLALMYILEGYQVIAFISFCFEAIIIQTASNKQNRIEGMKCLHIFSHCISIILGCNCKDQGKDENIEKCQICKQINHKDQAWQPLRQKSGDNINGTTNNI